MIIAPSDGVGTMRPGVGTMRPGVGTMRPGVGTMRPGVGTMRPVEQNVQFVGLTQVDNILTRSAKIDGALMQEQ